MKKSIILFSICFFGVLLLVTLLVLAWKHEDESSIKKALSKTKTIIVDSKNEITNKDDVDKIVKILLDGTKMPEDIVVPYRGTPHHRLKMLDDKERVITEVNFFYYSDDSAWVSYDDEGVNYEIDGLSLLKLIES